MTAGPGRLAAAQLQQYAGRYGASVLELDRALGRAPGPADLVDLTHGDPRAYPPPATAAVDHAAAVTDNTEAYSPYRGSAGVRREVAPRVAALLGRDVDPGRNLVITPGTQGGLFATLSALVEDGDPVVLADPDYFMNERIVAYLGGRPLRLPVRSDGHGGIEIDPGDLDAVAAQKPRLLLVSNPNNPTGGVYSSAAVASLAELVTAGDMWAVVDQLYCRLVFDRRRYAHLGSLPGMEQRTVSLLGPSKTESMSGYRVGVAAGPEEAIDAIERVISMTALRAGGYSQHALRHWMAGDGAWLDERIAAHQEQRDRVLEALRAVPGLTVATPGGSSYVFPDVSGTPLGRSHGGNDHAIATALKQAGALVSPGYQFGPAGWGHFRINFSQDPARLELALRRITAALAP